MRTSQVALAAAAFAKGNYAEALEIYERLGQQLGERFFAANIKLCKKRLPSHPVDAISHGNKCKANLTEFFLTHGKEAAHAKGNTLLNEGMLTRHEVDACLQRAQGYRAFIDRKPTILVAGHDLRFVSPFIDYFKCHFHVLIDEWALTNKHNEAESRALLNRADIIWCEWCCGNAVWYSRHLKQGQKLVVRLHRFEIETDFPTKVDWHAVNSLIFIAPGLQNYANEKHALPCQQHLLYNGFPVDAVAKAAKNPRDRKALACTGYIPQIKRLDRVLDFYEQMRTVDASFSLHLKGKSAQALPWVWAKESGFFEEQDRRIESLRASGGQITISPYDDTVHQWVGEKGFLLSASDIEGSHQAVAEAMAAGTIPLIFGDWVDAYQARFLYPGEICFNTTTEAVQFASRLASDPAAYERLSRRLQTFAHENFNSHTILQGALDILQGNSPGQSYISISERPCIGIFSDLSIGVIDGSTVWLFSLIECLLQDPNIDVCLVSSTGPGATSPLERFAATGRFFHRFPAAAPVATASEEYARFLDHVIASQKLATIIVRATAELSECLLRILPREHFSKLVYYLVGEAYPSAEFLSGLKGILLQTEQSKKRFGERHPKITKRLPAIVLPPMLPIQAAPSFKPLEKPVVIAYSGKMSRGYMALELARAAADAPEWLQFDLSLAKFYHPDGKDYVDSVKKALALARASGRTTIHEQLSRDQVLQRVSAAHFGWSIRSESFRDSTEISTKVLEYCALGKPPLVNKFPANISLLGEDYPFYIEHAQEVPRVLERLLSNPKLYEDTARLCADKASAFKMNHAYHRIIGLIL